MRALETDDPAIDAHRKVDTAVGVSATTGRGHPRVGLFEGGEHGNRIEKSSDHVIEPCGEIIAGVFFKNGVAVDDAGLRKIRGFYGPFPFSGRNPILFNFGARRRARDSSFHDSGGEMKWFAAGPR